MAKNWTMAEAANVIATNGINNEDVMDFGRRFPVTTNLITAALAGDKEAIKMLLLAIPAYVTMGKMEKNFKEATDDFDGEDADVEDTDADDEEAEATEDGEKDYSAMNNKQLKAELRKAGFKSADIKGKNKAAMLAMLNGAAPVAEDADEDEEDEAEESAVDYSKMSARELYKICKSKGIDVEQKKPAKYYIDAINAAEADDEEEDGADEWEDEETAPVNKPAKATKPAKAPAKNEKTEKPAKNAKAAKPAKAAKSEDEEWDI